MSQQMRCRPPSGAMRQRAAGACALDLLAAASRKCVAQPCTLRLGALLPRSLPVEHHVAARRHCKEPFHKPVACVVGLRNSLCASAGEVCCANASRAGGRSRLRTPTAAVLLTRTRTQRPRRHAWART